MKNNNTKSNKTPRFMIAAASSGSGKTVITCALLEILKRRGSTPCSFKCGPDYIDPMFHEKVLGIKGCNLDSFFEDEAGIRRLVSKASGDISVIEGVMGIYDGKGVGSLEGSCYEIAKMTATNIILIVNAKGIGQTVISVIKGILADDAEGLIKGIILNRMSKGFYEKLRPHLLEELCRVRADVRLIGFITEDEAFSLKSRHLGLTMPQEVADLSVKIAKSADIISENCDIEALIDIPKSSDPVVYAAPSVSVSKPECNRKIAIARDEAFCFYYRENIRLLEELGAKIVYFSPLRDRKLPDGTEGIIIGGGYPELFLERLAKNHSMKDSIRDAVKKGIPSAAECGGFMYLHDMIVSPDGNEYEMCGIVNGRCTYTGHLVNFGYTQIQSIKGSEQDGLCKYLPGMRGHEFHYYESTCSGSDAILCKLSTGRTYEGMHIGPDHAWGWPHLYYRSIFR